MLNRHCKSRRLGLENLECRRYFAADLVVDSPVTDSEAVTAPPVADIAAAIGQDSASEAEVVAQPGPTSRIMNKMDRDVVSGDAGVNRLDAWEHAFASAPDARSAGTETSSRIADEYLGVVRWDAVDEYFAALDRLEESAQQQLFDFQFSQPEGFHVDDQVPAPGSKWDKPTLAFGPWSTPADTTKPASSLPVPSSNSGSGSLSGGGLDYGPIQ